MFTAGHLGHQEWGVDSPDSPLCPPGHPPPLCALQAGKVSLQVRGFLGQSNIAVLLYLLLLITNMSIPGPPLDGHGNMKQGEIEIAFVIYLQGI